jgi:hypothetical protein
MIDPISRLLYFETEFSAPNKSVRVRVDLISQYDRVFADISEVVESIPSRYVTYLLNGLEMAIRDDISKRKVEHEIEIKRRQNKSLKTYCAES